MAVAVPLFARRYWLPISLFALGLFFQLVVLPSAYPPSHYDALGAPRYASVEVVTSAYEELSSKWLSGAVTPSAAEFIKIRYAFELLTNPVWKRDYDIFGIDEKAHLTKKLKDKYNGEHFSKIHLPLLDKSLLGSSKDTPNSLTSEEFMTIIQRSDAMLIQVYSVGSARSSEFASKWERIVNLLDGVAETGIVELGDVKFASFLAERKFSNQPFFRNGLPAFVAFPHGCKLTSCYERYQGEPSVDGIVDWMATEILGLPRILYYSKESLGPEFIAKSGQHKVKVIFFSKTGERATPFLRQAAKDYSAYASFAFVLWREQDFSIWWNSFHVESAPAIVIFRDAGVEPFVYHGSADSKKFQKIMQDYKQNELPLLRSVTSMELGCDPKGYSLGGNDNAPWYCAVVVGRPGAGLSKMRETMRRARDVLLASIDSDHAKNLDTSVPVSAVTALKQKRLTFAWLDGELQLKYCMFYVTEENHLKSCGPRRYEDANDEPQIFMARYFRNSTEVNLEGKHKSIWDEMKQRAQNNLFDQETKHASQLVARYNGSESVEEIIQWISDTIERGETRDLPYFVPTVPDLVPEDSSSSWSGSSQGKLSVSRWIKLKFQKLTSSFRDYMTDPKIGSSLLLCACLSFATIWLQNSWKMRSTKEEDVASGRSSSKREQSSNDIPPSITDVAPTNAYQTLSDSE